MPTTLHENRPSAGIGVVEVQKPMVFCDFGGARATLCGDRRGRGAKTRGFLRFLRCSRDPLRGSAWSRCKNPWFVAISAVLSRLCGDRRGRGAKTHGFLRFLSCSRDPLRGSAWSRCKKLKNSRFLRFRRCSRNPLRGSARSRCKNPWFFAISAVLAQPSAGIGVVEVQKPMVFCDFCGARATFCGDRRGRGAKTRGFLRLLLFELVLGSCLVVRAPAPGPAGRGFDSSLVRGRASQDATCILKQLAQTNLHRPVCAERLA